MRETSTYPIYKGPIKAEFRESNLPAQVGNGMRHMREYEFRHGNENFYLLQVAHYQPRHARGSEYPIKVEEIPSLENKEYLPLPKTEVLPRRITSKPSEMLTPPRAMIVHLSNDIYEQRFDLSEYRNKRKRENLKEQMFTKNYFRECIALDTILLCFSFIFTMMPLYQPLYLLNLMLVLSSCVLLPIFLLLWLIARLRRRKI